MSDPLIITGIKRVVEEANSVVSLAVDFAVGQHMLNVLGYGDIAAAAGTPNSALSALVVGKVIFEKSIGSVESVLENTFQNAPFTLFLLKLAARAVYLFAIGAVGAIIYGLAEYPLGLCMVAGGLVTHLSVRALLLLHTCAVELARPASQSPHDVYVNQVPGYARNRSGLFANLNSRQSANDAAPAYSSPVHEQQLRHQA